MLKGRSGSCAVKPCQCLEHRVTIDRCSLSGGFKNAAQRRLVRAALSKGFRYRSSILRLHFPLWYRLCVISFMGVGYIPKISEPSTLATRFSEHGDTVNTLIDPSSEHPVPSGSLQHCCGIRPLCVYKELLIKAELIVVPRGGQQFHPLLWTGGNGGCGLLIQLRYILNFFRAHIISLPLQDFNTLM